MTQRLPVQHPEYKYPPSRNPYWAKLQEQEGVRELVYLDNRTEEHRGGWRGRMADGRKDRVLHVEIGCNAGHVLIERAASDAEGAYIGIDWKFKAVHRGAEKAVRRGLKNALFLRAHAERISYMLGEGEVDRLYLYFPDPWPKKAHWKNRYVTAERLKELARIVKLGGSFEIRTDHPGYFEWIEREVAQASEVWEIVSSTRDRHRDHPEPSRLQIPDVTLFERLFIAKGIKIHAMSLARRS